MSKGGIFQILMRTVRKYLLCPLLLARCCPLGDCLSFAQWSWVISPFYRRGNRPGQGGSLGQGLKVRWKWTLDRCPSRWVQSCLAVPLSFLGSGCPSPGARFWPSQGNQFQAEEGQFTGAVRRDCSWQREVSDRLVNA